ncbi:ABC transporter permease [Sedimentibacter sp. zth1]|uniref:ABC transporter permease n=1 Tax=Sedimentibacter sp. zth1 TaxID=2816908 RepID=UPI001A936BB9|nr:ABC transporter permease [Sedimentibacter sp. zth1]QSX06260.1 ABC transporter permease [Sedimentibacter sp. zth1]
MNKILKQSLGYFKKNKINVVILCILTFLTSFMYFFVECSIDKNFSILNNKSSLSANEEDFLVGLNSNTVLAFVFLVCLMAVTGFIFYIFYKKDFELSRKNIGCYRALGFTNGQITRIHMEITFAIGIVFTLLGLLVGYYFSYILLDNYVVSYHIDSAVRGVSFSSFFIGVFVTSVVISLSAFIASKSYLREETATLINGQSKEMKNNIVNRGAEKVSKLMVTKYSFSSRLALRKPFNLLLVLVSVYVFLVLSVISVSLNLSSNRVYKILTDGRSYEYEVKFQENTTSYSNESAEYFLNETVKVFFDNNEIGEQELTAIDNDGSLFQLLSNNEQICVSENEIVVNQRISQVYHVNVGDIITLQSDGGLYEFVVKAVADNGRIKSVYVNRSAWNKLNGNEEGTYSGVWSKELDNQWSKGEVTSYEEYLKALDDDNVSNRVSAVINQVLGCIFGILLLSLVLLLNFQDNTQNFIYLRKMGYLRKEIKVMLVNIYFPILLIAFAVSIIPSIFTSKAILRQLSFQTGDFMPFISSVIVFVYALAVLIVLYFLVLKLFDIKLKGMLKRIDNGDYK